MSDRRLVFLSLLLLALVLLILHAGVIAGQSFFWGLPSLQFVPWRIFAFQQAAQGILPWWNSLNGAGAPLIANYQSAIFYPFTWLTFAAIPWTMSLLALAHLVAAGWGMARLTSRLGAPALGQAIAALAFGLTSYLVARLGTYPIITTAAWSPWLIWAAVGILEDRPRSTGWTALFTALLLLAGHAQTAFYTLLLMMLFLLYTATRQRLWTKTRLLRLLIALALGTAASLIQLVPTAELLLSSQRGDGVDYDFAMNFSYAPARLLNLAAPNVFGSPADGSYFTEGAYFEDAVYVGMIPLISAAAAMIGYFRASRAEAAGFAARQIPFWIAVFVTGVIMAFGRYTPVFPFFYEHVPTFDLFQAPVRWHFWTIFSLSVLAAFGARCWMYARSSPRLLRWTRRLTFAAIVGAVVCALLGLTSQGSAAVLSGAIALSALFAAASGLLTLRMPFEMRGARASRWLTLVIVIIAADLALANRGLNPTIDTAFYDPLMGIMPDQRTYMSEREQDRLRFEQYLRFDDYRAAVTSSASYRESGLPNMNLLDGRSSLNNFDPLLFGPYAEYMRWLEDAASVERARLLEIAGAGGQPRAWIAASLCYVNDADETRAALLNPDADPRLQPVTVGQGGCDEASDPPGEVRSLHDTHNSVILQVVLDQPGWLILADTDYPGWHAFSDDGALPIVRVNYLFRAVQLSAGAHTVRFEYQPGWLFPSAMITVGAWLAILVIFRLRFRTSA